MIWRVSEDEKVIDLLFVGPKSPNLYEQLGLGKRMREGETVFDYEVELDRNGGVMQAVQDATRTPAVNG